MTCHRRIAWIATLALGGAGAMTLALAQQPPADATTPAATTPPATAPAPAPADSPAPTTDATTTPDAAETGEKPAAAPKPKPATAKGSPQHFEPTEKVRPDFDVAFPIDI